MLTALEFDLYPYVAQASGENHVDYQYALWSLKKLLADDSSFLQLQIAHTTSVCKGGTGGLSIVLPDSCGQLKSSPRKKFVCWPPPPQSLTRTQAILAGIQLLERKEAVTVAILDMCLYETSITVYSRGVNCRRETFGNDQGLGHLLGLFAERLAAQTEKRPGKKQPEAQARLLLSHLYRPAREQLESLPLPQEQIDATCAEFAQAFCKKIECLHDDFAKAERIYLTGGGSRLLAPWLLPEFKYKVIATTAREHFVAQAAMAHHCGFLRDLLAPDPEDEGYDLAGLIPDSGIVFLPKKKTVIPAE